MKMANTLLVLTTAVLTNGCAATKDLTETSARSLIREYAGVQKQAPMLSLAIIHPLLIRTTQDYTLFSSDPKDDSPSAIVKRLLDRKYVLQTSEIVSYRKINGTFTHRTTKVDAWGQLDETTYHLESVSGASPGQLTGTWHAAVLGGTNGGRKSDAPLKGTIGPDDKINLAWGPYDQYKATFTYVEEGGRAILRQSGPPCYQCPIVVTDYIGGEPTREKGEVKWYNYVISMAFRKLMVDGQPYLMVPGGTYEIGEVTNLKLTIETRAEATFAWQVTPNELGHMFFGDKKVSGSGRVEFAKKPDGTWFVDRVFWQ